MNRQKLYRCLMSNFNMNNLGYAILMCAMLYFMFSTPMIMYSTSLEAIIKFSLLVYSATMSLWLFL